MYIACCLRILRVYTCSAFSLSAAVHSLPAPLLQFLKKEVPSNGIAASCFVAVSLFYVLTNSAQSSNFSAFYQHCYFLFWVVFDNDVFVLGSSHLNKCKVNPIVLFVFLNSDGGHFSYSLWSFLFPLLKKWLLYPPIPHTYTVFFLGENTRSARMTWNHFKFLPLSPPGAGFISMYCHACSSLCVHARVSTWVWGIFPWEPSTFCWNRLSYLEPVFPWLVEGGWSIN